MHWWASFKKKCYPTRISDVQYTQRHIVTNHCDRCITLMLIHVYNLGNWTQEGCSTLTSNSIVLLPPLNAPVSLLVLIIFSSNNILKKILTVMILEKHSSYFVYWVLYMCIHTILYIEITQNLGQIIHTGHMMY